MWSTILMRMSLHAFQEKVVFQLPLCNQNFRANKRLEKP
jgi:hypothetical protein